MALAEALIEVLGEYPSGLTATDIMKKTGYKNIYDALMRLKNDHLVEVIRIPNQRGHMYRWNTGKKYMYTCVMCDGVGEYEL